MREILFRAKRIDNGEWVEGWYQPPVEVTHCDGRKKSLGASLTVIGQDGFLEDVYIIPETIGWFTGLTDKNRKKIFEGDIIAVTFSHPNETFADLCVVEWKNAAWQTRWETGYSNGPYEDGLIYIVNNGTIIGNIHDNPELLEGTDNTVAFEGSIGE